MFRFTIRELLILTVTAGLAVGWWLEHAKNSRAAERLRVVEKMLQHTLDMYEEHTGRKVGISADGYSAGQDISYHSQKTESATKHTARTWTRK